MTHHVIVVGAAELVSTRSSVRRGSAKTIRWPGPWAIRRVVPRAGGAGTWSP
jgi:hypothetical protein